VGAAGGEGARGREGALIITAVSVCPRALSPHPHPHPAPTPRAALHHAVLAGQVTSSTPLPAAAAAVHEHALRLASAGGLDATACGISAASAEAVLRGSGVDFAPVAAIMGGMLGAEVVKVISRRDAPVQNLFVFDAMGGLGGTCVAL
jgi:hypothetical protein